MRLHYFLDCRSNVAKSHVDTRCFYAFISSLFHGGQKWIKHRIECNGKSTIDDVTVDLCSEIDLHDIVIVENSLVAGIWSIMSCAIVYAATSRETDSLLNSSCFDKAPICILYLLTNINELHSRSHDLLSHLPNLTVTLSCFSQIIHLCCVQFVSISEFCVCRPHCVEVSWMIHPLSLRENIVGKLRRDRNGIINCLFPITRSPTSKYPYLRIILFSRCILRITTLFSTSLLFLFSTSICRRIVFIIFAIVSPRRYHLLFLNFTLLHFFILDGFFRLWLVLHRSAISILAKLCGYNLIDVLILFILRLILLLFLFLLFFGSVSISACKIVIFELGVLLLLG